MDTILLLPRNYRMFHSSCTPIKIERPFIKKYSHDLSLKVVLDHQKCCELTISVALPFAYNIMDASMESPSLEIHTDLPFCMLVRGVARIFKRGFYIVARRACMQNFCGHAL